MDDRINIINNDVYNKNKPISRMIDMKAKKKTSITTILVNN